MQNFTNTPSLNNLPKAVPIFPLTEVFCFQEQSYHCIFLKNVIKKCSLNHLKVRIIGMIQPLESPVEKNCIKLDV